MRSELRLAVMSLGKAFLKMAPLLRSITALNATTEKAIMKKIERGVVEARRRS